MKRSQPNRRRRSRLACLSAVVPVALLCLAGSGAAAPPAGAADLQVTQVAGAGSVEVGDNVTYTITVTNLGPETASGVTVEDALPSNVKYVSATSTLGSCALQGQKVACSLGSIETGPTAKVGVGTITLTLMPTKAGSFTNIASVHGDQGDAVPGNNQASVTTTVTAAPGSPPKYKPPHPPHKPRAVYCRGVRATIVGTRGDDTLLGTRGPDVIVAFGGDDTIRSFAGRDLICAGNGNDNVRSGRAADRVFGGAGRDRLLGQGGPDLLKGQAGNDMMKGGRGSDRIRGGTGFDRCRGGSGRDSIRGCER